MKGHIPNLKTVKEKNRDSRRTKNSQDKLLKPTNESWG